MAAPEFDIPAKAVKTHRKTKRLFVLCPACELPNYLGAYGAAHLAVCDLFAYCECGARLTILREDP